MMLRSRSRPRAPAHRRSPTPRRSASRPVSARRAVLDRRRLERASASSCNALMKAAAHPFVSAVLLTTLLMLTPARPALLQRTAPRAAAMPAHQRTELLGHQWLWTLAPHWRMHMVPIHANTNPCTCRQLAVNLGEQACRFLSRFSASGGLPAIRADECDLTVWMGGGVQLQGVMNCTRRSSSPWQGAMHHVSLGDTTPTAFWALTIARLQGCKV